MLAEPVSAGIEVCRFAVTSRPMGMRMAQAMRTTTMPMTKPVMPLRLSLSFFAKFMFNQVIELGGFVFKYRLMNRKSLAFFCFCSESAMFEGYVLEAGVFGGFV